MTNQEIIQRLEELPSTIARLSTLAEEARYKYEQGKALYDNEYNKTYLKTKAVNPKYTQDQVKAESESLCYELWLEVIKAESTFKSNYIKMVEANDKFQGAKVVARLNIMEMGAIKE